MPWKEVDIMSQRKAFVEAAQEEGANMSELCRHNGISRETGYRWLRRYQREGVKGLAERSRRPHRSPARTPVEIEQLILAARQRHPTWGGRKLKRRLEDQGHQDIPTPSTITEVLRRYGQLDAEESAKRQAMKRFEKETPNELWQVDFKGDFVTASGQRCYPLSIVDDCTRFGLGLLSSPNCTHLTVKEHLTSVFRLYGLPEQMLMDNGAPWGNDRDTPHTVTTVWLLRLGVKTSHGRAYHPQTQGKVERFHRTLKADLLTDHTFSDLDDCQRHFDQWLHLYNYERPHEALALDTPASHYRPSSRPFPESLPPLTFPAGAAIRKVDRHGVISYLGRRLKVGKAFREQAVGLIPDPQQDGLIHVFFNAYLVRSIDLH